MKSGVGAMIGTGVYVLDNIVAVQEVGPGIPISIFVAATVAGLPALCYAELACRFPSAGSVYHYAYICIGEM